MAKSSPEKLAQALRANLKRRKQAGAVGAKEPSPADAQSDRQPGPASLKSPVKTPNKTED